MPIVSQSIHTNEITRRGDRRTVRFLLTDHLGITYLTSNRRVDINSNLNLLMSEAATLHEATLARSEEYGVIDRVESGEDALTVVDGLDHGTKKQAVRQLIRWAMKSGDVYNMLDIKPVIEHLKSRFNGAQIANFLDISPAQLTRLIARYNKIVSNETDLGDVRQGEVFK